MASKSTDDVGLFSDPIDLVALFDSRELAGFFVGDEEGRDAKVSVRDGDLGHISLHTSIGNADRDCVFDLRSSSKVARVEWELLSPAGRWFFELNFDVDGPTSAGNGLVGREGNRCLVITNDRIKERDRISAAVRDGGLSGLVAEGIDGGVLSNVLDLDLDALISKVDRVQ